MRSGISQLANLITLTRIVGVGVIFWVTPFQSVNVQLISIIVYTLICSTDFLDGWIARKLKIVSDLGKILDPLADKIVVLIFLPLLEMQVITSFPVFIILAREFAIMALRVVTARQHDTLLPALFSGKIKTAITLPVCGILLARVPVPESSTLYPILEPLNACKLWVMAWPNWVIQGLIYSTVLVTLWSFLDYFGQFIWAEYLRKWNGDEAKAKRALRAIIPNMFSALNLASGILVGILALAQYFELAVFFLIVAIFSDSLDGALARRLDASSAMGETLDSIADFISFGLAPTVLLSTYFTQYGQLTLGVALSAIYAICVLYRLRRFSSDGGHQSTFLGLPSPMAAGFLGYALVARLAGPNHIVWISLALSLLMISRLKYPHLSVVKQTMVYKVVKVPYYILTILSCLSLVGSLSYEIPFLYDITLGFTCIYLLTAFLPNGHTSQN